MLSKETIKSIKKLLDTQEEANPKEISIVTSVGIGYADITIFCPEDDKEAIEQLITSGFSVKSKNNVLMVNLKGKNSESRARELTNKLTLVFQNNGYAVENQDKPYR